MSEVYGYARKSLLADEEHTTLDAVLDVLGSPRNIYVDIIGEPNRNYMSLKRKLSYNDELIINDIDELGDSLNDIQQEWDYLTNEVGVKIRVLNLPGLNEQECSDREERQKMIAYVLDMVDYLDSKYKEKPLVIKSSKVGRPKIEYPRAFEEYYVVWKVGKLSARACQRALNIKPNTWYRMVRDYEKAMELPFM